MRLLDPGMTRGVWSIHRPGPAGRGDRVRPPGDARDDPRPPFRHLVRDLRHDRLRRVFVVPGAGERQLLYHGVDLSATLGVDVDIVGSVDATTGVVSVTSRPSTRRPASPSPPRPGLPAAEYGRDRWPGVRRFLGPGRGGRGHRHQARLASSATLDGTTPNSRPHRDRRRRARQQRRRPAGDDGRDKLPRGLVGRGRPGRLGRGLL